MAYFHGEKWSPVGHQIAGVLLAFLVVFRTQIAWGQYYEGRNHLGSLLASSRDLANELIGAATVACQLGSAGGDDATERARVEKLVADVEEAMRLLKLFYFVVIEHARSSEGHRAWHTAHAAAYEFTTKHERDIFDAEFGPVQA
jgi:hypothetical protein